MAKLSLICPCYNEAENLSAFCEHIFVVFADIIKTYPQSAFECIFINDGSTDSTLSMLCALQNMKSDLQNNAFLLPPPPLLNAK